MFPTINPHGVRHIKSASLAGWKLHPALVGTMRLGFDAERQEPKHQSQRWTDLTASWRRAKSASVGLRRQRTPAFYEPAPTRCGLHSPAICCTRWMALVRLHPVTGPPPPRSPSAFARRRVACGANKKNSYPIQAYLLRDALLPKRWCATRLPSVQFPLVESNRTTL